MADIVVDYTDSFMLLVVKFVPSNLIHYLLIIGCQTISWMLGLLEICNRSRYTKKNYCYFKLQYLLVIIVSCMND